MGEAQTEVIRARPGHGQGWTVLGLGDRREQCGGFLGFLMTVLLRYNLYTIKFTHLGNSLAVQWLGLHTITAKGPHSIPGWGTKIPLAAPRSQKQKSPI